MNITLHNDAQHRFFLKFGKEVIIDKMHINHLSGIKDKERYVRSNLMNCNDEGDIIQRGNHWNT